ncbi:DUF805 domain-containing protein [Actinomyces viscosus]|uniref:DUF805 domain-containing protein n=1 Tax=Actinomyces viscosus TaxID=1656 RepID=UPI0028E7D706|nr:DUF805 domain-containing protein [Actinomyces viscosus]
MTYGSGPAPYPAGPAPYGAPQQFGAPQFGAPHLPPNVAPLPGASFGDALKRYFQRYAQFRGYASPSEFWWPFLVLQMLIPFVLYILAIALGASAATSGSEEPPMASFLLLGLLMIYCLAIVLPSYALMVRRLHDTGKSGLFVLFQFVGLGIIPLILCCMGSRPDLYRPEWS